MTNPSSHPTRHPGTGPIPSAVQHPDLLSQTRRPHPSRAFARGTSDPVQCELNHRISLQYLIAAPRAKAELSAAPLQERPQGLLETSSRTVTLRSSLITFSPPHLPEGARDAGGAPGRGANRWTRNPHPGRSAGPSRPPRIGLGPAAVQPVGLGYERSLGEQSPADRGAGRHTIHLRSTWTLRGPDVITL
ncbi:MAG: hypothetical protein RL033_7585 [Pseudomonadota bacterium]